MREGENDDGSGDQLTGRGDFHGEQVMTDLQRLEEELIANGRVEGHELRLLRGVLYADGKIDRREADFLVELHKRVPHRTHRFERFFYNAIKAHVLEDGRIGAEETAWLRQMIF